MKVAAQILLLLLTLSCANAFGQNRAPSCWLKYNDNYNGDILINTVRVVEPSPLYTYYCTMQWNAGREAGGYCGIQEHPDGRNFIYSIWDPISSDDPIQAAYLGPGTETENFGGEGTGLKSWNFTLGWETGAWYTFVTRAWDYHGHTHFGYWVWDQANNIWHHLVTMDFPVEGVRFSTSTGSFIEDWLGNGWNQREVHHKDGWKRGSSGRFWRAFEYAYFERVKPDNGAVNYIDNYDGGITNDAYYFMISGGSTEPDHQVSGTNLHLDQPLTKPVFDHPQITLLTADLQDEELEINWEISPHGSPQFSFVAELIQADEMNHVLEETTAQVPHQRSTILNTTELDPGDYLLRLIVEDIFGLARDTASVSIHIGLAGVHLSNKESLHIRIEDGFLWTENLRGVKTNDLRYRLVNLKGQVVDSGEYTEKIKLPRKPEILIFNLLNKEGHLLISKMIQKK